MIGDTRTGIDIYKEQIRTINLLSPDLVVDVGDLIGGYIDDPQIINSMWDEFDTIVSLFQVPFVMVPGNHDIWDLQSEAIWEKRYGPKYFSFVHKKCHFIILNSESLNENVGFADRLDDEQYKWLEAELKKYSDVKFKFVFLHMPFWQTQHVSQGSDEYWETEIHPLLAEHNVDAVFAGHVHKYINYGLRDGVAYYITGGGGAGIGAIESLGNFHHYMLITVRGNSWQTALIRQDGIVRDDVVTSDSIERFNYYTTTPLTDFISSEKDSVKKVTLNLFNPVDRQGIIKVNWQLPPKSNWVIHPTSIDVPMQVGEKKKIIFDVSRESKGTTYYPLPRCIVSLPPLYPGSDRIDFDYALPAKPIPLKCKKTRIAPVIDGKIDDPCWDKAESVNDFVVLEKGTLTEVNTKLTTLYDEKNFYMAFRCQWPKAGPIKSKITKRDGEVWNDDNVEIFIDHNPADNSYLQLGVNSLGTIFDQINMTGPSSWDGKWKVAATEDETGWSVEIALEIASASIPAPKSGTVWRFNACRNCTGDLFNEYSSWSFCQYGFHEQKSFGQLVFE